MRRIDKQRDSQMISIPQDAYNAILHERYAAIKRAEGIELLAAYALWLEGYYTSDHSTSSESSEALRDRVRAEHGVLDLLEGYYTVADLLATPDQD